MHALSFGIALAAMASAAPAPALAEPTEITIRVISKDAKFIGTSMGGMRITLRDAHTGEVLARGLTEGGTGNTPRIMQADGRRAQLSDNSTAKFVAILDLSEPRLIEVEAFGPLAQVQGAHRAVSSQWVVPGKNVSGGDGWVLELPGFVVDVLGPPAHMRLPVKTTTSVDVRANVVMMCGCPIEPGGVWNARKYEVMALVSRDGKRVHTVNLTYAGTTSQFAGSVPIDAAGTYEVLVYAYDPANGNTGLDGTTFIVE
jgi:hypothetical protein